MRLKLLLRQLTVSAPRMAVRSALPWPLRWVAVALVAGFCAAIALWAFEAGRELAGIDVSVKTALAQTQAERAQLQQRVMALQAERDEARRVANTAETLMTTEKTAQARLAEINQQLQQDNQRLRDDLGFFQTWLQATGKQAAAVSIRGLRAQTRQNGKLEWQVLVVQSNASNSLFTGRLELQFNGQNNGKPWSVVDAASARPLSFERFGRAEGVYAVPARVRINSVTARVLDGQKVVSEHTARL